MILYIIKMIYQLSKCCLNVSKFLIAIIALKKTQKIFEKGIKEKYLYIYFFSWWKSAIVILISQTISKM